MNQYEAFQVLQKLASEWNEDMTARAFIALEQARQTEGWREPETTGGWDTDGIFITYAILFQLPELGIRLVQDLLELVREEQEPER